MTPASDDGELMLSTIAPRRFGLSGVARAAVSRNLPFDHVEFTFTPQASFRFWLQEFVHRQRQHIAPSRNSRSAALNDNGLAAP